MLSADGCIRAGWGPRGRGPGYVAWRTMFLDDSLAAGRNRLCRGARLCQLPLSIARFDRDLYFGCGSKEFIARFGVTEGGRRCHLDDLFDSVVRDRLHYHLEACRNGATRSFRSPLANHGGVQQWIEFTVFPDRGECREGGVAYIDGYLVLTRDLPEESAALMPKGADEPLDVLTSGIPAPICCIDTELRYTYANQSCLQVLDKPFEEVAGRHLSEILSPADYLLIRPRVEQALQGEPVSYERIVTLPGGEKRWMNVNYSAIRDENGEITGVWAIFSDIDRLKKAEIELRNTHRILAAHIENTPFAVAEWDQQLRLVHWSRRAEELFEWRFDDLAGKREGEFPFVFEADRAQVAEAMNRLAQGQERHNSLIVRIYRKDGSLLYCECHSSAVHDEQGNLLSILTLLQDVSERHSHETRLLQLATRDPLTGVYNRTAFSGFLDCALSRARRERARLYLLFIDLDHFKQVNDRHGHQVGDEVLKEVVARLRAALRETDVLSRMGGDEFTVIIEGVPDRRQLSILLRRVLAALSRPYEIAGAMLDVSASIGVSAYPENGATTQALVENADQAMYRVKGSGRNGFHFLETPVPEMPGSARSLEQDIGPGLASGQFYLVYQPRYCLYSRKLTGVEALLRWSHPEHGEVGPDRFIDAAVDSGMIHPLGNWVVDTVRQQILSWHRYGFRCPEVSVNVVASQLGDREFLGILSETSGQIDEAGAHCRIEIELSERELASSFEQALDLLRPVRNEGIRVAVDNYGCAKLSLNQLVQLAPDTLKIERGLVGGLQQDDRTNAAVRAIIGLAGSLGLRVTAEGIESHGQREFLLKHGCSDGQGYLLGRPMTSYQLSPLLGRGLSV